MIIECIKNNVSPGTVIPKPAVQEGYVIKGWGKRRGEEALIYYIPNRSKPEGKPYEKGINVSEWRAAYEQLMQCGELTRKWFDNNLSKCSKEGGCSFTTIGGVFEFLGIAQYEGSGKYIRME